MTPPADADDAASSADHAPEGAAADDVEAEPVSGTDLGLTPDPVVAAVDAEDSTTPDLDDAASASPATGATVAGSSTAVASTPPPSIRPLTPEQLRASPPQFQPRRTWAQRALLTLNCLVILACLVGATTLLVGRNVAHSIGKVDIADPNAAASSAVATVPIEGTTGGTVADAEAVTVSTLAGDTAPPPTQSTAPPETFPPADPTAKNFLITGADNNACIEPDSPYAGAFGDRETMGERSDTVMVMRVDPANKRAAVLSFPRDLWVQIADTGRKSRINSAYVKDDPTKLIRTIVENFGVGIDHFVQVDFCAFKRLVEAVGGVKVPFDYAVRDENTGLDVPATAVPGCFAFDGDHALAYVRSRYYEYLDEDGEWKKDASSDLGRISRQQDFIRRALDAALEKGVYNPSVARGLIDIATQSIVVDSNLTPQRMLEFFGVLRDFQPGTIRTYQIEAVGQKISGNDVLVPRLDGENMQAILHIFQGIAPLAAAPEQVFESTTTTTRPGDDASATTGTDTASSTPAPTTTSGATTTTVFVDEGPEENVKGIVPPDRPC